MKIANYNLNFDNGWYFHLGDINRFEYEQRPIWAVTKAGGAIGILDKILGENEWTPVRVPHDWCMSLPYDRSAPSAHAYKKHCIGWYYNKFTLRDEEIESARLVFEGVLGQTTVYVNGIVAARNFSGYNRFTCEISDYLLKGQENMIALCVDATPWEAWSYEGAGLYRNAYIEFRESTHIDTYGCFVRSEKCESGFEVIAELKTVGNTEGADFLVKLTAPDGKTVCENTYAAGSLTLTLPVEKPMLWSPEQPSLYKFLCELKRDGDIIDTFSSNVGLRTVEWDKDRGLLLNGEKYLVKGICCHQDHGGVGASVTRELVDYRISLLKKLGANAYRCVHHEVSEDVLDACDRQGLLVMAENRSFSSSADVLYQLEAMVLASRNHSSVFLYSLFNEEPWQKEERGYRIAKRMREHLRKFDTTRAVTGAMDCALQEGINAADAMDVVGLNYYNDCYDDYHKRYPDKALIGTENCPTFATRGVYEYSEENQEFSSYGDYRADFTISIEETMKCVTDRPWCAGCFAWSGFDSYGEPNPYVWPSIMSHWGVMDICGFPKDTAYLLAAYYKTELFAHLFPHWNYEKGEAVRICTFTNADIAELFVNGRSVGAKTVEQGRAEWSVPFEAGEISIKSTRGSDFVTEAVKTAGNAARLVLEDVTPKSNEHKIRIINITATDENGVFVPTFNGTAYIENAEVLGVANGNPNAHQANIANEIPLFNGRAQMIVTADSNVTVSCDKFSKITI